MEVNQDEWDFAEAEQSRLNNSDLEVTVCEVGLAQRVEIVKFPPEIKNLMGFLTMRFKKSKDVFIRELINNAASSLDKIRYESLTDPSKLETGSEFYIKIVVNKEEKTLTVIDTGIGMTKSMLYHRLGEAVKSGVQAFREAFKLRADTSKLGVYGVGFFTSYLVADRVTVITKHNDDAQYIWESCAGETFTIHTDNGPKLGRGSKIILTLKDEELEFCEGSNIKEILHKKCHFMNYPIQLVIESTTYVDVEDLSRPTPILLKDPVAISYEEYLGFYKHLTYPGGKYMAMKPVRIGGGRLFQGIIYIPYRVPDSTDERTFKLYIQNFLIMDKGDDIFPNYLSFIRGAGNSQHLPTNVSRENLLQSRVFKGIGKKLIGKCLELFQQLAYRPIEFKDFYEKYNHFLKMGVIEDARNMVKLVELLRYSSNESPCFAISFRDYVSRMKEDQKFIFYITGISVEALRTSPFAERLKTLELEYFFMTSPIDDYVIDKMKQYDGIKFMNISKHYLDLPETNEDKRKFGTAQVKFEGLCNLLKKILGQKVEKVVVSKRLVDSPCCIVTSHYGWSANMERTMKNKRLGGTLSSFFKPNKRILEINPDDPIIENLRSRGDAIVHVAAVKNLVLLLLETSWIISGFPLEDPTIHANRVYDLTEYNLGISGSENDVEGSAVEEDEDATPWEDVD